MLFTIVIVVSKKTFDVIPCTLFHIAGIFTAAFDDQIEWLIVKGIADYADGAKLTAESWRPFASVMAASVVSHILSDPIVFSSWPHHGGKDGKIRSLKGCHTTD